MFTSNIKTTKAIALNVGSTEILDNYIKNIQIQIDKHTTYLDNSILVDKLLSGYERTYTLMRRLIDATVIDEYEKKGKELHEIWENRKREIVPIHLDT